MTADRARITVEVSATQDATLVWSDSFEIAIADIFVARGELVSAIASAIQRTVPRFEAEQARRLSPEQYDAWSHFHVGLSHAFRYTPDDTVHAARHFQSALDLNPEFSRAHSGLSFVHFQTALLQFDAGREASSTRARQAAETALRLDETDPFAAFNMGRAHWLVGDPQGGTFWLERALSVNPNAAQAQYMRGAYSALMGEPDKAAAYAAKAISLSPLDPMLYAMRTCQAFGLVIEGKFQAAVDMAERAVESPNAHYLIGLTAAVTHELAGNRSAALRHVARARAIKPGAGATDFSTAFRFQQPEHMDLFMGALRRLGLD